MNFKIFKDILKSNNFDQFYIQLLMIYNLFLITVFATFIKGYVLLFLVYFLPLLLVILFFLIKIFFYKKIIKFPYSFYYTVVIFFILIIIGLIKKNNYSDILSNAIFFISPLLSYYLISSIINNQEDKIWMIKNIIILSSLQIIIFFLIKFFNVFLLNKDLVNYEAFNVGGLQSSFLILAYFLFLRKKYFKLLGIYFIIFISILILNEILVPIVLPFKQLLLLLLIFLVYVFFYIIPKKYLFFFVLIIVFITTLNLEKIYVFTRLFSHFKDISSNSIFLDKRIIEIYGVVNTIKLNLPFSLIYGEGFGGLWDTNSIGIDISYLKQVDFRKETFVSMVHSSFFTLLIRGGLLSVSCYLIMLYIVFKRNNFFIKKINRSNTLFFYFKSFKLYFLLYVFASFFDWYIYANCFIGILFAISTFKPNHHLNEYLN